MRNINLWGYDPWRTNLFFTYDGFIQGWVAALGVLALVTGIPAAAWWLG